MQSTIEELKGEIWKDIPQDTNYQASNFGRIRSKDRYVKGKHNSLLPKKGRVLKRSSSLMLQGKNYFWSELILSAFGFSYDFNNDQIIHLDGDVTNDCIENIKVEPLKQLDVEWKNVPEWEGIYQVSSDGQVVRLPQIMHHSQGFDIRLKGQVMKPHPDTDGYLRIGLSAKGRKSELRGVHQLVAKAFILNPENKPTINHINGIKYDNRLENLEWATYKEQSDHAIATGLRTKDTYKNATLALIQRTSKPVRCIQTGQEFPSCLAAEQYFHLYASAVHDSINGRSKNGVGPDKLSFELI